MAKYTRGEIAPLLRKGIVEVTFTKSDGTTRVMRATLEAGVAGFTPPEGRSGGDNNEVLTVYDTEKRALRSFRIDSVKKIKEIA